LEVGGPRLEATKDVAIEVEWEIEAKATGEKSDYVALCLNLSFNLLPLASNLKRSLSRDCLPLTAALPNERLQVGFSERLAEQERLCSRVVLS
jgi:hypothetical protein